MMRTDEAERNRARDARGSGCSEGGAGRVPGAEPRERMRHETGVLKSRRSQNKRSIFFVILTKTSICRHFCRHFCFWPEAAKPRNHGLREPFSDFLVWISANVEVKMPTCKKELFGRIDLEKPLILYILCHAIYMFVYACMHCRHFLTWHVYVARVRE